MQSFKEMRKQGHRPTGTLFIPERNDRAAADLICGEVLDWLNDFGYDLRRDLQV